MLRLSVGKGSLNNLNAINIFAAYKTVYHTYCENVGVITSNCQ